MKPSSRGRLFCLIAIALLVEGCAHIPLGGERRPKECTEVKYCELQYYEPVVMEALADDWSFFHTYNWAKYREALKLFSRTERLTRPNPILELEKDLLLLDELMAILKLNHIILTQMNISTGDCWPELLNAYHTDWAKFFGSVLGAGLIDVLAEDLGGSTIAIGQLEICRELGVRIEHTKAVIGIPPSDLPAVAMIDCSDCPHVKRYCDRWKQYPREKNPRCGFFSNPVENCLFDYQQTASNIGRWIERGVYQNCLRQVIVGNVSDKRYYPFILPKDPYRSSFYSLFPRQVQEDLTAMALGLKATDSDIIGLEQEIGRIELGYPGDKEVLKRQKLEKERKRKRQENALDECVDSTLKKIGQEITGSEDAVMKYVLSRKLKAVCDYVLGNLNWVCACGMALPLKFYYDYKRTAKLIANRDWKSLGLSTAAEFVAVTNAARDPAKVIKRRISFIADRLKKLPKNYLRVISYSFAQQQEIRRYRGIVEKFMDEICRTYPDAYVVALDRQEKAWIQQPKYYNYRVESGDTLGTIAVKFTGVANNWKKIVECNKGIDPDRICPGQTIKIPRALLLEKFK